MSASIDYAAIAWKLRFNADAEGQFEAAAKLCEAMPLVLALLERVDTVVAADGRVAGCDDSVGYASFRITVNAPDVVDMRDAAERLREAVR